MIWGGSTIKALSFKKFSAEWLVESGSYLVLKPSVPQGRGIIPEKLSLIDAAVSEKLTNKQTQTDTQTHRLPIALEERLWAYCINETSRFQAKVGVPLTLEIKTLFKHEIK